jgi:pimeloyl-ACP methyl ester carboxylesterase
MARAIHQRKYRIISAIFALSFVFGLAPHEQPAKASGIVSNIFQFPQGSLHQFKPDGSTAIAEGGSTTAGTVVLGISFASNVITPLRLQVELRPASSAFVGVPTASGGIMLLAKQGVVTVSGLADGSYHWRARLQNMLTGVVSGWQEFGMSNNTDFTVALREPVVIVPGISGSVLVKSSDGSEAWPNIGKMLVSPSDDYLDALMLDAAGNDARSTIRVAGILATARLTAGSATLFSDDFYGNLINAFKNEGYVENQNLFAASYDWRIDITRSASVLAAKIAQAVAASPTGKINIVVHSMGGLVLKEYLASVPQGGGFLDKVVLVGVPELGAPYAFKILNYGDDLNIPIANSGEIKKIAQNMPAIYELLPSRRYVGVAGGYVQDFRDGAGNSVLDYSGASTILTNNPVDARNVALLSVADNFHQAIDNAPVVAPNIYNIAGCGKPTITGFDLYDDGAVDLERGSGDGTVPEVSAMNLANTAHDYFVLSGETGIDHTGLTSDARPVALIKNIVDGNLAATLPQGISAREADCASQSSSSSGQDSTVEFSISGSENLGVYDAAGDFTGSTASGTVARGIPGSEYDQLGSSTFVLVPAGGNYRAMSGATASGTFVMKVRGYRGATIDREANYLLVSAADTSTVAELDFSGFEKNMDLKLGHRGHAGIERIHHPDSVISAAANLKDRMPPTITVSPLPREVVQNATETLLFAATDTASGVATTTATFNGVPVANGAVLKFVQLGKNTLKIEAIDSAGNPQVKRVEVDVRMP